MRLSELHTGEKGVIVKVMGHGGFRKRIIEMGFVKGKAVEVLLNAPLNDPVKYRIMGYEVSLRRSEAEMIEVVTDRRALPDAVGQEVVSTRTADELPAALQREVRTINVALVGNPNCGKTSLFNFASGAHGRVGNYSGVTVDASVAHADFFGYGFNLTDLPGTYSLSCYSPEELYVRTHLTDQMPDVVINVIDSTNLERNLYLTTQLIDMNLPVVCALNMFDEFEKRGDRVDTATLGTLLGTPFVPTSFRTGMGVEELFRAVIDVFEGTDKTRHIHINYGHEIEDGIAQIQSFIKPITGISDRYSTRYIALKLLEHDTHIEEFVRRQTGDVAGQVLAERDKAAARVLEETKVDSETAIMDSKYGFINGALTEARHTTGTAADTYRTTHLLDNILSNKYLGFPIFFLMLFVMFETTFVLGQYPMDWIDAGVAWLGQHVSSAMADGPLKAMLVDGVIGGVGSVIVFLPQILILYLFISFMEDSGYMARAAFIMDRLMHNMGLHGKSFIPLIMGFGCNVPAVMATRTIESRRSRLITMIILPFMSCSARLPIYIMIVGALFPLRYRSLTMMSLYVVGIIVAVLMSKFFSSTVMKGEDTPFVMELPPYRWPTSKAIGRHTWDKAKEYLKKMGGIILVASIIVWALGYFPHNDNLSRAEQQEQSYIGRMGQTIEPVFSPQGFNWKLDVSLIAGVGAKEIVASTMGVLYIDDESFADDDAFSDDSEKYSHLRQGMLADGITPLSGYCFLLFILLYFPCVATVVAVRNETGSWKWALFMALYTTATAWIISALAYQIGSLFV